MSTFDHKGLIQNINGALAPFRKSQAEPMAAFGQLARSAMAEGAISEKHKELMALAIGITLGLHWLSREGLGPFGRNAARAGRNAGRVRVHGRRPSPHVRS